MTEVALGSDGAAVVCGLGRGFQLEECAERKAESPDPADTEDVATGRAAEVRGVGVPGAGLRARHVESPAKKIGQLLDWPAPGDAARGRVALVLGGVNSTMSLGRCLTSSNSWV